MAQIKLLQCSVDAEDESELRILLDGKDVRYLTIEPGVYEAEDMCFEPAIITLLPPLPHGEWVCGTVSRDPSNGNPYFKSVDSPQLPGVMHTWHNHYVEYLQLSIGKKLRTNVYEAFDQKLEKHVILKFARFAWEIPQIDAETQAYQWIDGRNISPQFLGHVTEDGRVIGFVMEHAVNVAHAAPKDLAVCQKVLSQLHDNGILHGDINRHNFLVGKDRTVLIDFDVATKCADKGLLAAELKSLNTYLHDTSGKGGSSQD